MFQGLSDCIIFIFLNKYLVNCVEIIYENIFTRGTLEIDILKCVEHKMANLYTHVITFVLCDIIEIVYANVSWTFKPEIIRIGETLSLLCTVDGIDSINGGLIRQWTKGSELICFNGHPINPDKYREIQQNGNQFELKIYNISESDLQCKYQCRYGFDTQTKKLEISEHNFENPPANDTRATVFTNTSDGMLSLQLHLNKVYPIPNCTITGRGTDIPFKIVKLIRRKDIYYKVYMRNALPNSTNCDDNLEVTCRFIIKYHIPVEKTMMCEVKSETTTDKKILIGLLISLIIIVAVVCMITWIMLKRRKSKERIGNYNADEKRSCDMTFTSSKLDDDSLCNSIQYGKEMNDDQQKPFLVPDSKMVV
ncbi:unnamed protein product [Mytilus coruscus]|uniref:Ig-like domain-containing protein n=1 Tax=Mytilus coruscus TaxID=42192 RepID=A0A6J8CXQ1_MYTCO|nr:unnamed protein product [Mytilus coruscus]